MSNDGATREVVSETSALLSFPEHDTGATGNTTRSCNESRTSHQSSDAHTEAIDEELKKRVFWALPALAIGIFLAAADQTIVVSSYGKIGSEMNALNNTSWIATACVLSTLLSYFADEIKQLSANADCFPTALWPAQWNLWAQGDALVCLWYFWAWVFILRTRHNHESAHRSQSLCRNRRRRPDDPRGYHFV